MSWNKLASFLFYVFCLICIARILCNAWVADDAYITFRVLDNAIHGYGLRWNIDERVQVFTHPLWLLLQLPFYAVFGHIFLVTIVLSAVLAIIAVALLLGSARLRHGQKMVVILLPLLLSHSFTDHAIDGLETPLTLCLIGWFYHCLIHTPQRYYRLLFIASLAVLARFDNAVMLLPPLLWVTCRCPLTLRRVVLSVSPLLVWCAFSLLYYGFIFPNTAYAKLDTGIARSEYMAQGLYYFQDFIFYDGVAAVFIISALGCALFAARQPVVPLIAASIVFQLFYVMCIGGDFMAGRFLVAPFYLALLLCALAWRRAALTQLVPFVAVIACIFYVQYDAYHASTPEHISAHHGIADERAFARYENALFAPGSYAPRTEVIGLLRESGQAAIAGPHVVVNGAIGVYGYYAGPGLVIIDPNGLSDPLLARLPVAGTAPRIGHFARAIPAGYIDARDTGDTSHMDPSLAHYYEKLRLITSGALWSRDRLRAMVDFQLGESPK